MPPPRPVQPAPPAGRMQMRMAMEGLRERRRDMMDLADMDEEELMMQEELMMMRDDPERAKMSLKEY